MAAVCAALFDDVPAISLYVNHFNVPARRVYARLGFREEASFATLIF
jgi:predicted GNAT family acetyltransferase